MDVHASRTFEKIIWDSVVGGGGVDAICSQPEVGSDVISSDDVETLISLRLRKFVAC